MKKFRELTISIGSDALAVRELDAIKSKCNGSVFGFSEYVEKMYAEDERMLHITANMPETKSSIIFVYASGGKIKVLNIVPQGHGSEGMTKDEYNAIIDRFDVDIIQPLFSGKYQIEKTPDVVQMQDIIPETWDKLFQFVSCPGWPEPFNHPFDREKWNDFVCSLSENNEYLSAGDFELWLLEDRKAGPELVETIIQKYEDATSLLDYYVSNYR